MQYLEGVDLNLGYAPENKHLKMLLKVLVTFSAGGDYFLIKNDTVNIATPFHSRFVSNPSLS